MTISDVATATGNYSFYLQRTNDPGQATVATFGSTYSGTIDGAAQMGTYTVSASSGDRILARIVGAGASFYTEMIIYKPDGAVLCSEIGTPTRLEIQSCLATTTGNHTIVVGNRGNSSFTAGNYSFYLQRTNNPTGATATSFGTTIGGTLNGAARNCTICASTHRIRNRHIDSRRREGVRRG